MNIPHALFLQDCNEMEKAISRAAQAAQNGEAQDVAAAKELATKVEAFTAKWNECAGDEQVNKTLNKYRQLYKAVKSHLEEIYSANQIAALQAKNHWLLIKQMTDLGLTLAQVFDLSDQDERPFIANIFVRNMGLDYNASSDGNKGLLLLKRCEEAYQKCVSALEFQWPESFDSELKDRLINATTEEINAWISELSEAMLRLKLNARNEFITDNPAQSNVSWKQIVEAAKSSMGVGNKTNAKLLLEAALKCNETDHEDNLALAKVSKWLDEHQMMLEFIKRAEKSKPVTPGGYFYYANALKQYWFLEEAEEMAQKCLEAVRITFANHGDVFIQEDSDVQEFLEELYTLQYYYKDVSTAIMSGMNNIECSGDVAVDAITQYSKREPLTEEQRIGFLKLLSSILDHQCGVWEPEKRTDYKWVLDEILKFSHTPAEIASYSGGAVSMLQEDAWKLMGDQKSAAEQMDLLNKLDPGNTDIQVLTHLDKYLNMPPAESEQYTSRLFLEGCNLPEVYVLNAASKRRIGDSVALITLAKDVAKDMKYNALTETFHQHVWDFISDNDLLISAEVYSFVYQCRMSYSPSYLDLPFIREQLSHEFFYEILDICEPFLKDKSTTLDQMILLLLVEAFLGNETEALKAADRVIKILEDQLSKNPPIPLTFPLKEIKALKPECLDLIKASSSNARVANQKAFDELLTTGKFFEISIFPVG